MFFIQCYQLLPFFNLKVYFISCKNGWNCHSKSWLSSKLNKWTSQLPKKLQKFSSNQFSRVGNTESAISFFVFNLLKNCARYFVEGLSAISSKRKPSIRTLTSWLPCSEFDESIVLQDHDKGHVVLHFGRRHVKSAKTICIWSLLHVTLSLLLLQ